jgi:proteasome accessory factor A
LRDISLNVWQGEEVEYGVTPKEEGAVIVTYVNDLLEALREYRFEKPFPSSVFLSIRAGVPTQFTINGGRVYGDARTLRDVYDVFEVATPECRDALELVAYDKAGEIYAYLASQQLKNKIGKAVHCYKTGIAFASSRSREYTTRGAHENYLVERDKYLNGLNLLIPFLTFRQIFCGVGAYYKGRFIICPRSMFIRKLCSTESTYWPLISLRDEPHADRKYFRAQIGNSTSARCEFTNFLKHSITSYVLLCIQRGKIKEAPELKDPLYAAKAISRNIEGDWEVELQSGEMIKVVDYLNSYYVSAIEKLFAESEVEDHDKLALDELKFTLNKLDNGLFEDLNKSIEWIIKLYLIERGVDEYFEFEKGIEDRKEAASFQYTAVTDTTFDELADELKIRRVTTDEQISRAVFQPPKNSRAELRVTLAKTFKDDLEDLKWSEVIIKGKLFRFLELDGWSESKISEEVRRVKDSLTI